MDSLFDHVGVSLPRANPASRTEAINAIGKYLMMQDVLECRSIKEVQSLAAGLYDSVVSPILTHVERTAANDTTVEPMPFGQLFHQSSRRDEYVLQAAE